MHHIRSQIERFIEVERCLKHFSVTGQHKVSALKLLFSGVLTPTDQRRQNCVSVVVREAKTSLGQQWYAGEVIELIISHFYVEPDGNLQICR